MAYRLPTHLESLVPPPAEQVQQRRPWQGVLTLTFTNAGQGTFQDVYVTAAETDGERCVSNTNEVVPLGASTKLYQSNRPLAEAFLRVSGRASHPAQ
jgi:hypothetical protein